MMDNQTNRLIKLASMNDFEEEVSILDSLLEKHCDSVIYSNLVDSHIYILKHWVVKYLQSNKMISTIKGELLPYIVSKQNACSGGESNSDSEDDDDEDEIYTIAKENDTELQIRKTSTYIDHRGDMNDCYNGDSIRCYAHVASSEYFGFRINTLPAYWSTNGKVYT